MDVRTAARGRSGEELFHSWNPDVVVTDLLLPDLDGLDVLQRLKRGARPVEVIVLTGHASVPKAVEAMRAGAFAFVEKPIEPDALVVTVKNALEHCRLRNENQQLKQQLQAPARIATIVGRNAGIHALLEMIRNVAPSDANCLIVGENGTGKELVANTIHALSNRAKGPFIKVNCAAIPADLIESELFGHKKGSFTGATSDHAGKFTEAHGGTLFLDEIGELPMEAQAKLLRALQDGEIEPVGATRPERVNVRVISATNRRLLGLAQTGEFREDLYYRLNVFPIYLPPLRERPEDVEALATHFIARFAAEAGKRIAGLSTPALELLAAYNWPGNIRQLENAIYRAIVLSDGGYLELADFPQIVAQTRGRDETLKLTEALPAPSAPVHIDAVRSRRESEARDSIPDRFLDARGEVAPLPDLERELIAFALKHYGGRMSKVARALKIGRSTLYRKLRDYGLEDGVESDAA
jgi:DNA-binding NtrC family response regulator